MLKRPKTNELMYEITPSGAISKNTTIASTIKNTSRDILRAFFLIKLDIKQQVFGHKLGHFWLILEPALQAGVYYFLLSFVFNMKGADSTFASFLVALVYWRSHAMLMTSAPLLLSTKGSAYIDQGFGVSIAFLEFAIQELFLFAIRFIVLIFFLYFIGYQPTLWWFAALFVGLCMFCFSLGLSIWLAMLGVLFKDSAKFIGHLVWLWWYISPGLYSFGRIPDWAKPIFMLNPFTYILSAAHSSFLRNEFTMSQFVNNCIVAFLSLIMMYLGWILLKKFSYVIVKYI